MRYSKLQQLQHILPEWQLVNPAWLEKHGYSGTLRSNYTAKGWLENPARGVYRRPGCKLLWQHVVLSLPKLGYRAFIGGKTALEEQGFAHFVHMNELAVVHLYADDKAPGWLNKLPLHTKFTWHNRRRLFAGTGGAGLVAELPWGERGLRLTVSSPAQAMFELLDELPDRESFENVFHLLEGVHVLNPDDLHRLLHACRSVKVKRLLCWYAGRLQLDWCRHIDPSKIDLGKGKRQLVRNGTLDKKLLITVPDLDFDF